MKKTFYVTEKLKDKKGVAAVYIAIFIVVFIGFTVLAVDVGYMMVSRNQLHDAADAAALAGARQLGENYHLNTTPLNTGVEAYAISTASLNKAAGSNLAGDESVVYIGTWDWGSRTFTPTPDSPDAVQVTAMRNAGTTNQGIGLFFAPIFNISKYNAEKMAIAALTGPCEGKPTIPIGIANDFFEAHGKVGSCTDNIQLNDTNTSCAGWTNLIEGDKTAKWKDIEAYMVPDPKTGKTTPIPTVYAQKTYEFVGGTITGLYEGRKILFDANKSDEDGDGDLEWTTYVIVYEGDCGLNPSGGLKMLGFTKITITEVIATGSDKKIYAHVACGMTTPDPGGCAAYGTYSYNSPRLVQ